MGTRRGLNSQAQNTIIQNCIFFQSTILELKNINSYKYLTSNYIIIINFVTQSLFH